MSTVTINGKVWTTQTMPTAPIAPASMEFQHIAIVAESTNPFNAQEQFFNWNVSYKEASISYATMTNANAQAWLTWLEALNGPLGVFRLAAAVCNVYLNELTLDGLADTSNPRYFRMKSNSVKWAMKPGGIYSGLTFECREVL